jgi:hypothetical protein
MEVLMNMRNSLMVIIMILGVPTQVFGFWSKVCLGGLRDTRSKVWGQSSALSSYAKDCLGHAIEAEAAGHQDKAQAWYKTVLSLSLAGTAEYKSAIAGLARVAPKKRAHKS